VFRLDLFLLIPTGRRPMRFCQHNVVTVIVNYHMVVVGMNFEAGVGVGVGVDSWFLDSELLR
jgi:hypothetical protein